MNNKDKEYTDIEATLGELDDEEDTLVIDSLSTAICDCCGARLTMDEYAEWESMCEECMYQETNGLIDDNVEEEL